MKKGRIMKNKTGIFAKISLALAACFLFASFSPSLDGRAVVVEDGVFPQGLFAKTVGYLPGDVISVASISGDSTVDILVIGALDPSEGVAIMLSPEAATAIGIDRSANNIVKITKRSGQDDRVFGTAVIAKQNNAVNSYSEKQAEEFDSAIAAASEEDFDASPVEEITEAQETFEAPVKEEIAEEVSQEMPVEEEAFEEEIPVEETAEEIITDEGEETIGQPVEESFEENVETPEQEIAEPETAVESVEEETEAAIEEEAVEETIEAEPFEEEFTEEYETISEEPEEPQIEEEMQPEEDVTQAQEEQFEDEAPEDIPEEPEIESEYVEGEELSELEDENIDEPEVEEQPEEEEYEAIVLVPSEANPPVEEITEENTEESIETEIEELSSEETVAEESITEENISEVTQYEESSVEEVTDVSEVTDVEEISEVYEQSTTTQNVTNVRNETNYQKYMVDSLSELKSSSYYIQIAALSSDDAIMEIVNKYCSNYPITIVPMAGGQRKQVMIGPVNMDEYAVILERFKSYGFKDAFLRKIK